MAQRVKDNLVDMKEKLANTKKEMRKIAKVFFSEGSQELFDTYPNLVSFAWRQYTPYFNDGEECVFSAHVDADALHVVVGDPAQITAQATASDEDEDEYYEDEDEDEEWETYYSLYDYVEQPDSAANRWEKVWRPGAEEKGKMIDTIAEFLANFDDDDMLFLFGNHATVTVSRTGIDVTEYAHE